MPWIEFEAGRSENACKTVIRTEAITKMFEHRGEYGLSTGICVSGQDEPTWVSKRMEAILRDIERAEKNERYKTLYGGEPVAPAPNSEPETPAPSSPNDLDDDIQF